MTYISWQHEDLKWLNKRRQDCRNRYYAAKRQHGHLTVAWECMKLAFAEEKKFWDEEIHKRKNKLKEVMYGKGF